MAITTSIEITNITAKKLLDGKEHVITAINFDVTATDGTYTAQDSGVEYLGFDKDNFIEWADTPAFKAQVVEWTKPQSDELLAVCVAQVTELAKDEDETLEFTFTE